MKEKIGYFAYQYFTYLIVAFIVSIIVYFRNHFLQERFCVIRFVIGVGFDFFLAFLMVGICDSVAFFLNRELPTVVYLCAIALGVARGDEWIFSLLDAKLKK